MKDPQTITQEDEYWMGIAHSAMSIARDAGYKTVTDCAVTLYGYDATQTQLTLAEYVVHKHTLAEADRIFRARMAEAETERQRDRIAEDWEAATAHSQRLVGA